MVRFCDKCRKSTWPRTSPSFQGNFKCEVCGAITWCHNGPDSMERQITKARELFLQNNGPPPIEETKETKPMERKRHVKRRRQT